MTIKVSGRIPYGEMGFGKDVNFTIEVSRYDVMQFLELLRLDSKELEARLEGLKK